METKLRVLLVNKAYYPHIGGIETVVQYLAEGMMHKSKIHVEVLACGGNRRTEIRHVNGVSVRYVAQWATLFSLPVSPTFPLWLQKYSGNILHIHEPFPLADLSVLTLQEKIFSSFDKVVVSWHSDIVRQKWIMPLYGPLLHRFLSGVDRIIVATPHHIRSSNYLPEYHDKCEVIPYGIPLNQYERDSEANEEVEQLRAQIGTPILLFVGRLVHYKGVEYLIEAMQYLQDCRLVIVGTGPLESDLRKLAAELEVDESMTFRSDLPERELTKLYHACDIFVLPSIEPSEAFGIVQLEAMACGKPVVSTNLETGVTYVNEHGKTGLTVPPQDAEALAGAIQKLLEDPVLCRALGEYAQKRVRAEFSTKSMVDRTCEFYEGLLNGSSEV